MENEIKVNKEKSVSWSENGFLTKIIISSRMAWLGYADSVGVEIQTEGRIDLSTFLSQYDFFWKLLKI